jgi:hypothetical protein
LKQLATDRKKLHAMGQQALERIRTGFDIQVTSQEVAQALGAS